jgi:LPXTG-motif cell wall-anchored protein
MEQSQDGRIEFIVVGLVILFAILLLFGKKRKHTNSPLVP